MSVLSAGIASSSTQLSGWLSIRWYLRCILSVDYILGDVCIVHFNALAAPPAVITSEPNNIVNLVDTHALLVDGALS